MNGSGLPNPNFLDGKTALNASLIESFADEISSKWIDIVALVGLRLPSIK
jgi:hypothetical protein